MIYVNFVCTGNTCRSPMAAAILRAELKKRNLSKGFRIKSSGIYAHEGDPISENSRLALKSLGIPVPKHTAKLFVPDKKHIVITMTTAHKAALPSDCKAVSIAELTGGKEVGDPYGGSLESYQAVAAYLQYATEDIIKYLLKTATTN